METCQLTKKATIQELNYHHTALVSPKIRPFTHELKMFAQSMAKNDMRPSVIRNAMSVNYSIDASKLPSLTQVQQHVATYRRNHLANHEILEDLVQAVDAVRFTGKEADSQVFSFGYASNALGRPHLGRGTDSSPFFVGFSTRRLILQLDRNSDEYVFHVDATFKLAHVDFPTIVCGISGRAREFHLVALFQTSQRTTELYQQAITSLRDIFRELTGRHLQLAHVMGDAEAAQYNGVLAAFRGHEVPRYLMCYYHVVAKVLERTRSIPEKKAKNVLRDIYNMHFSRDAAEFRSFRDGALTRWRHDADIAAFADYFNRQWLQGNFSNWQCYWTPAGFATTNNPLEQFNNIIKSRHTMRQRLKMGRLLTKLQECCHLESGDAVPVSTTRSPTKDLISRAALMEKSGNLWVTQTPPMQALLGDPSEEDPNKVRVCSTLLRTRVENGKRFLDKTSSAQIGKLTTWHNQRMEVEGQPASGWLVDVVEQTCPCKYLLKYGYCIHLICALKDRGIPYPGEKVVLFDRSSRNGRNGRSRRNGPALTRI